MKGVIHEELRGTPNKVVVTDEQGNADYADKSSLGGSSLKETTNTSTGVLSNVATPAAFIRFTGTNLTTVTGFAGGVDGRELLVVNDTPHNLTLSHLNAGSQAGNRLQVQGGDDVYLYPKAAARFVYSVSGGVWRMAALYGSDFLPSLRNRPGTQVVTTTAGYQGTEEVLEIKNYLEGQLDPMTKEDLNIAFPAVKAGVQVICANITGGGKLYEKLEETNHSWISSDITVVA